MDHEARPESGAAFRAVAGLALLAGTVAGLVDAVAAVANGLSSRPLGLAVYTASFAAGIALVIALPVACVAAWLGWPRSAGRRLGLALAVLAASPAGILLARAMHKRIPWDASDLAALAGSMAALAVGVAILTEIVARVLGRRAAVVARAAARVAPWLAVALLPVCIHAARVVRPPSGPAGSVSGANLLLLTVDTLRADRLGCYGDPRARTPQMDRLARTGLQYEICVTPSPWTLPSLASLHTGEYPGRHRVLEEVSQIAKGVPTLAEDCRAAGLRTAAFVSNPWLATGSLARGFDVFDVAERPAFLDPIRGTRLALTATKVLLRLVKLDDGMRLSRKATSWIRGGRGTFFLWVHWFDPHLPNWPASPFDRLDGPPPRHVKASLTVEAIRAGDFAGGEEGRQEIERLYAGEVAYTDRAIRGLLRSVEAADLGPTTIVLAADHGEEFWEHGGYGHGHSMFDEVVRVPFVVQSPEDVESSVEFGLRGLTEAANLARAAATIPAEPAGDAGPDPAAPRDVLAEPAGTKYGEALLYGVEQKYIRTDDWKLIWTPGAADSLRLFDLGADPAEQRNLSGPSASTMESMFAKLRTWNEIFGSGRTGVPELGADMDPAIRAQLEALGYLR